MLRVKTIQLNDQSAPEVLSNPVGSSLHDYQVYFDEAEFRTFTISALRPKTAILASFISLRRKSNGQYALLYLWNHVLYALPNEYINEDGLHPSSLGCVYPYLLGITLYLPKNWCALKDEDRSNKYKFVRCAPKGPRSRLHFCVRYPGREREQSSRNPCSMTYLGYITTRLGQTNCWKRPRFNDVYGGRGQKSSDSRVQRHNIGV